MSDDWATVGVFFLNNQGKGDNQGLFQTLMSISFEELCVQKLQSELGGVCLCKAQCQFNIWKPVRKEQSRFLACSGDTCLLG